MSDTETAPQPRKTRTITLTGRAPVKIYEDEWPTIAQADDYAGSEHRCQANEEWWIKVRRHADGRMLVYARRDAGDGGQYHGYHGAAGGELIDADADAAAAIARVGETVEIPQHTIDECIADLPAVRL